MQCRSAPAPLTQPHLLRTPFLFPTGRDTAEMHHYVAGEDESLYVGAAEDTERDFDGFADAFTDVSLRVSRIQYFFKE